MHETHGENEWTDFSREIRVCTTVAAGTIPPKLGELAALTYLDLGDNALSGESLVFTW